MANRATLWNVMVVDRDADRRAEMATHCTKLPEVGNVTGAGTLQEAISELAACRPDLVILDPGFAEMAAVSELGRAAKAMGACVILLTADQEPAILAKATEWASGLLPRGAGAGDVGHAIQVVRTGAFYMDSDQAREMVEELDALREAAVREPGGESLTPREKDVLRLLSEGLSARQMARRLELSERTINTHVANVYRKLAVSNRVQAVRQAIRMGLVDEAQ